MTVIRRRPMQQRAQSNSRLSSLGILVLGLLTVYILASLFSTSNNPNENGRQSEQKALDIILKNPSRYLHYLAKGNNTDSSSALSPRLRTLLLRNEIVGDHLGDIKAGLSSVEDVLQNKQKQISSNADNFPKPPMTMTEIIDFLSDFLHKLHDTCTKIKRATFVEIWQAYHDLALEMLYPWDREYLQRMPERRFDGSIFLSLASYRDENCVSTITNAYGKAKNPEQLNVGLVQQNCEEHCRSGVLEGGKMEDVEPDEDCHKVFCSSPEGKPHCDAGRVRAIHVKESESLGPYAARYFASKLWNGEQWYMQIDSHMTFLQDWDALSIEMLRNAPSQKPVISHYPPPHTADLVAKSKIPAPRLCGPVFAPSDLEAQIIRLEGLDNYDKKKLEVPRFAPFVAAGYFVAHSDFLREVPFDPFLPWIFMGEEIIMSARLWTSGYDIFSPTQSVLGHIYVRRHKPKFWESVHRTFTFGIHNPLQMLILNRVKYQLGYPESARDMILPKNVLTKVEEYGMGTERKLDDFLESVGLDMMKKEVVYTAWCETGQPPKGFEEHSSLYI